MTSVEPPELRSNLSAAPLGGEIERTLSVPYSPTTTVSAPVVETEGATIGFV